MKIYSRLFLRNQGIHFKEKILISASFKKWHAQP